MTTATGLTTRLTYDIRGEGTPIVLLHGLTFDRTTWGPIAERLGDEVQTIAVDLPAHGESPGPPAELEELAERIHELVASLGVDSPVVVGHSIGGSLAFLYAGLFPTLGVVCVDQPQDVRAFSALVKQLEPVLRGPGFTSAFELFQESMAIDRVPEPIRSLVYDSQRIEQNVVVGYWEEVLRSDAAALQTRIDEGLATVGVPALAIFGRPLPDAEGHGLTHVRDLEIEEWPGLGHFPHLVEPDRFTARLREFIERVAI
jgi:pimeloyl-ACP methyl ester carboxylesterase